MKSRANKNQKINNKYFPFHKDSIYSINSIFNPNKTFSTFINSLGISNNDTIKEYKSSFIHKCTINEYLSKNDKKEKLFPISNSKQNLDFKIKDKILKENEFKKEKFQTRLIKEIKLNLEKKNLLHKNNSNQKPDFIKKNILHRLKESKYLFQQEKHNKTIKNMNYNNLNLLNTSRTTYSNNLFKNKETKKKKYHIQIVKNNNGREKESNHDLKSMNIKEENKANKNTKRIKFNSLNLNKYLKTIENRNPEKNIQISDLTMNENELTKRRTFIENDNSFIKKTNYVTFKIKNEEDNKSNKNNIYKKINNNKSNEKEMNKYISLNNKRKKILKSNKNVLYFKSFLDKKILETSYNMDLFSFTKGKNNTNRFKYKSSNTEQNLNKKNNIIKSNKTNKINQKKHNKENIESKNIKPINIKLKQKKGEMLKKNYINKKKDKNTNKDKQKINDVLDIESEHKNEINKIKTNNFDVKKPTEINMKYTFIKEFEDDEYDEKNKNINKSKIENIVIGKIDGYKDIIESDELNKKFDLRSKSSFEIRKKNSKKLVKNKGDNKNIKNFSNKKTSFMTMHILDDNSSEIEDLDFDNNELEINGRLVNIENECDFEDMPTFENETKINNDLLPFHASKISFCHYYDKNNGQSKTNEKIDNDIISLADINKELDKFKKKNNNNTLKNSKNKNMKLNYDIYKCKKDILNKNNTFSLLSKDNKTLFFKNNINQNKNINNNINKFLTDRKNIQNKDKIYIINKKSFINGNICNSKIDKKRLNIENIKNGNNNLK